MKAELVEIAPTRLDQVQQVVDHWIAVEEAIVGGVVWQIVPEVCDRFVSKEDTGRLTATLAEREEHPQYHLLRQAIQVVTHIGPEQALTVYRNNPSDFQEMITHANDAPAMQPAQGPQTPVAG
jgi:hypothetical protein